MNNHPSHLASILHFDNGHCLLTRKQPISLLKFFSSKDNSAHGLVLLGYTYMLGFLFLPSGDLAPRDNIPIKQ